MKCISRILHNALRIFLFFISNAPILCENLNTRTLQLNFDDYFTHEILFLCNKINRVTFPYTFSCSRFGQVLLIKKKGNKKLNKAFSI